jgi:hypothetical protein
VGIFVTIVRSFFHYGRDRVLDAEFAAILDQRRSLVGGKVSYPREQVLKEQGLQFGMSGELDLRRLPLGRTYKD